MFFLKNNRFANATENGYDNLQLETRVKCDASCPGLREAFEQLTVDGWKPITLTSRFLNYFEERYSFNELEFQFTNTSFNSNKIKYAYPASQIPINTSLAKQNSTQFKQSSQNLSEKHFERLDTHFSKPNFPPIERHSKNISESR